MKFVVAGASPIRNLEITFKISCTNRRNATAALAIKPRGSIIHATRKDRIA